MPYNWKCCSLYPNNFGASALSQLSDFIRVPQFHSSRALVEVVAK